MKYLYLSKDKIKSSQIALGCMRIGHLSVEECEELILHALEKGINFFDHADIYGNGKCESLFGEVLARNPKIRKQMIIQTKIGICKTHFDSSKEHIFEGVNKALARLQTDYIDILLIHRPDALVDYRELGETFDILYKQGKVRHFGVSNMNPYQMELIKKHVKHEIVANQMQLSVVHSLLIDQGMYVNMKTPLSVGHVSGTLEYCMLHDITLQPWSVLLASWADGTFLDNPKYEAVNNQLQIIADKYGVQKNTIAVAWLLRHPGNFQPIIGTTSKKHLDEMIDACEIILTREEWYSLYLSNQKFLP